MTVAGPTIITPAFALPGGERFRDTGPDGHLLAVRSERRRDAA